MGIVFSGMFGFGLVLFTKVETDQHLNHILFGNMLGVTPRDLVETAIVAGLVLTIVLMKRRDLLLYCFDPQHVLAPLDYPCAGYTMVCLCFSLSLTIVASLKAVGIILVVAMLIVSRRHRLPADPSLREHAVDSCPRGCRLEHHWHTRQLSHKRRDWPLHRTGPDGGVCSGVSARAKRRDIEAVTSPGLNSI